MTHNHKHGTHDKHRCTLALYIKVYTQKRSQGSSSDGEPAEYVGSRGGVDAEVALKHVGGVTLEREYSRIVEHAEHGDNPEELAAEDVLYITELELLFGGSIGQLGGVKLLVKCTVDKCEDDEADESDAQQSRTECHRHYDCGIVLAHPVGKTRRNREDRKHAKTRDSHLKTHGKRHLLALKPFSDSLRHGDTRHFTAAAENHETECGKLGASRHLDPP